MNTVTTEIFRKIRPHCRRLGTLFAACFFFSLFFQIAAAAATVEATLDRTNISLGESATLTVSCGAQPQSIPSVGPVDGLQISFTQSGFQQSIVNGQVTTSFIYSYRVTPQRLGQFTIPSFQVTMNGSVYRTSSLRLTVEKADPNAGAGQFAFVRLVTPKTEVYVGELFPVEIQLYFIYGEDLQPPQLKGEGFVIGKQAPHTQGKAQVGQNIYNVFSFKMSISAAKAGQLGLGPAECNMTLRIPRARRNDIFADFFGGPYERRPANLLSEVRQINVLPLPANPPASFSGAIGNFAMDVQASPASVAVGDPITLKFLVKGTGTIGALALPNFDWRDFKIYPASGSIVSEDPLGLEGSKSFEQVIVPQNAEVTSIPPIEFSFFNPQSKAYQTVAKAAIPITVKPAAGGQAQPTIVAAGAPDQEPPPARDIVHIKSRPGELAFIQPPLLVRPWFLALQAAPLALWLAAFWWRRRENKLANDPKLRRRIETRRLIRLGLGQLRDSAQKNDSDQFFATVFRLLQEQLGERLGLPASAITEAVLDDSPLLLPHESLVADLRELFHLCNQARYAPVRTSAELMSLVPKVEKALGSLEKIE